MDPFTQVADTIIALLKTAPSLTGPYGVGVKPANIIDLTTAIKVQDYPVAKPIAGTAPQILVLPSRGQFAPFGSKDAVGNSRTTTVVRDFLICITTDTLRMGGEATGVGPVTLFSVEWAMLLAFVGVPPDLGLTGLVFKYDPYLGMEKGLLDQFTALSDTRSWTAVLGLSVKMYWGTATLLEYIKSITPS